MARFFSAVLFLAIVLGVVQAWAASYGPDDAKFTLKVPDGWTATPIDGGVQVSNGSSVLSILEVEHDGMTLEEFGDGVIAMTGLNAATMDTDGETLRISGQKFGRVVQCYLHKIDAKYLLSVILVGLDISTMKEMIASVQSVD